MSSLENELAKYKKKGFEVRQRRTLKHGERIYLEKERGDSSGAYYGIYIYYLEGDSGASNIREFLKDYSEFYAYARFDKYDKGFFVCSGSIDEGRFRDLKRALVEDDDILSSIKTKSSSQSNHY
ncbi:MAG: hypothetical protein ACE5IF_02700 [Candidatus Bathyarchaeia archaeon]